MTNPLAFPSSPLPQTMAWSFIGNTFSLKQSQLKVKAAQPSLHVSTPQPEQELMVL